MRVGSISMISKCSSNYSLKTQKRGVMNQSVDAPVENSEASFKGAGKALGTILRAVTAPVWIIPLAYISAISKKEGESFSDAFAKDVKDVMTGEHEDDDDYMFPHEDDYPYLGYGM